jgi:hypothetical protein
MIKEEKPLAFQNNIFKDIPKGKSENQNFIFCSSNFLLGAIILNHSLFPIHHSSFITHDIIIKN